MTYRSGGPNGHEITALAYYQELVVIAQERQRAFPWYSSARRRWRRAEVRYRQAVEALETGTGRTIPA